MQITRILKIAMLAAAAFAITACGKKQESGQPRGQPAAQNAKAKKKKKAKPAQKAEEKPATPTATGVSHLST